jgi:hypothetical protein
MTREQVEISRLKKRITALEEENSELKKKVLNQKSKE